jgi:microcystin-dependent protein
MSYTINGINANYPTGTFLPYGGTIDPSGWVICDGVARSNSDGRYSNLLTMSIGTSTGGYTPLNLKDCTMIGKNPSTTLLTKIGSRTKTLIQSEMPSHTHLRTITAHTSTHTHTISDQVMWDNPDGERPNGDGGLGDKGVSRTTSSYSHGHSNPTSSATGSGSLINILNSSYIINWIVKT